MTHFRRTSPDPRARTLPALLALALTIIPASLAAQSAGAGPSGLPTVPDTSYAAGYAAGDSLAAATPIRGGTARVLTGLAGGVLLGPGALLTLAGHPEMLLPGAGVVVAAAEVAPLAPPAPPADSTGAVGAEYGAGFEDGFRAREARKRRLTAWGSAGVSAVATFGALLLLVLSSGYT